MLFHQAILWVSFTVGNQLQWWNLADNLQASLTALCWSRGRWWLWLVMGPMMDRLLRKLMSALQWWVQLFYGFHLSNLPPFFLYNQLLMHLSLTDLFKESPLCFVTNYTRENPCLLLYCFNDLPAGPTTPQLLLSAFLLSHLFCLVSPYLEVQCLTISNSYCCDPIWQSLQYTEFGLGILLNSTYKDFVL